MHGLPTRISAIGVQVSILLCAAIVALSPLVARAQAQQRVMPNDVRRIFMAGRLSAQDKQTLTNFYKDVVTIMMKPSTGDQVPDVRAKGYKNLVRGVNKNPALDYVNKMLLDGLFRVATSGSYSPAAKYNAMLFLGELTEENVKPLPEALPKLMLVLTRAPASMDYLKPATLIGLKRFAQEGAIPQNQIGAVAGAMLQIVNETDPPAGRSASAHAFMRRSAAEVLAEIGHPGPNGEVVKAFTAIATNPKSRLSLRCSMARLLGELNYPAGSKIDVQQIAATIGRQTIENCQREVQQAEEADREPSRRVLLYSLDSAYEGLKGLAKSAPNGEAETYIRKLYGTIYSLYRDLDDQEKTPDAELAAMVNTELPTIEEVLQTGPPAASSETLEAD
ncbi:MAG: hypothetical protein DWQ37_07180 [Planctomycetota bacterium]|mgnify:CR=1 FL=1|nr:MAG: hypothetical protein DWQ37_07180 [Planctomycetota bacterium]